MCFKLFCVVLCWFSVVFWTSRGLRDGILELLRLEDLGAPEARAHSGQMEAAHELPPGLRLARGAAPGAERLPAALEGLRGLAAAAAAAAPRGRHVAHAARRLAPGALGRLARRRGGGKAAEAAAAALPAHGALPQGEPRGLTEAEAGARPAGKEVLQARGMKRRSRRCPEHTVSIYIGLIMSYMFSLIFEDIQR